MLKVFDNALREAKLNSNSLISVKEREWIDAKNEQLKGKWVKFNKSEPGAKKNGHSLQYSVVNLKAPDGQYHQFVLYSGGLSSDKILGKGGFGTVKLAQDIHTLEWVAIKVSRNSKANISSKSFKKYTTIEREILNKLKRIKGEGKRIHKSGTPRYYTAMKAYRGEKLTAQSLAGISFTHRITIAIKLLKQLRSIHRKEVIHCDIKPGNIILLSVSHKPKLIDFGLSLEAENGKAYLSKVRGTKGYKPPELKSGQQNLYCAKTDIWSMGQTLRKSIFSTEFKARDRKSRSRNLRHTAKVRSDQIADIKAMVTQMMAPSSNKRPSVSECIMMLKSIKAQERIKISKKLKNNLKRKKYAQSKLRSILTFINDKCFQIISYLRSFFKNTPCSALGVINFEITPRDGSEQGLLFVGSNHFSPHYQSQKMNKKISKALKHQNIEYTQRTTFPRYT